ncbi:magnesium/cobalt transporter CorA [Flavivirga amylovorans]|uniref:Magnesium transport protein CorA n=1 Tax=Flavivirga amylovorans TaxID=870486 RepID=A0ABT8X763_9FLAO|nr:magnesium/cobalt transporter CorA [Flavivirga amylovorans]MDO5989750.1 magnesium/cobalt transporter CorA [Flavivirga amylovorans]
MKSRKPLKRKDIGLAPGTAVYMGKKTEKDLYVEIFDYNHETLKEERTDNVKDIFSYEDKNNVTWININGLNNVEDIKELGNHYELHPLLIEDIVNTHQRPKLDEYEDYVFVVLKMLHFDNQNNLKIEHVSFVLGKDYMLSFQESEGDVFEPIRDRLRTSKGVVRKMGADYLLYALIDVIVDNYFVLIDNLSEKTEILEDSLFNTSKNNQTAFEIQNFKREILKIRRAVYPLREVVSGLNKVDTTLVKEKTHLYLGDLHDHIIQVSENIDIYREIIWGLMDMHLTTLSNKMNEVMKVLTIIATIFIPLTFIAGIYGMNFENIPELKYKYAYYTLWGVMILIFLGMLYYFKRKKWL